MMMHIFKLQFTLINAITQFDKSAIEATIKL